jgi:hypothetical protein
MNSSKLIVSWNLTRLAADLAAHLESLERAGKLYSTMQADDYLEPYNPSPRRQLYQPLSLLWSVVEN